MHDVEMTNNASVSVSNPLIQDARKSGAANNMPASELEYMSPAQYNMVVLCAQLEVSEKRADELEAALEMVQQRHKMNILSPKAGESREGFILEDDDEETIHLNDEHAERLDAAEDGSSGGSSGNDRLLTLSRVTLRAGPGDLIALVGQVGSGKSSVLGAILGDMRVCSGRIARRGRVAYVGQRPFIQNSSLRDNITFGLAYDEERYQRTLSQCALLPDLKVLPAGDMTEIGERGINISGGQKARVALARAVYYDADVYLLDDPLAAVDAHVGLQLFQECIWPLKLRGKCVVLVTNALQFTHLCTHIVVLKNGLIVQSGHFRDLMHGASSLRSPTADEAGQTTPEMNYFADMIAAYKQGKDEVLAMNTGLSGADLASLDNTDHAPLHSKANAELNSLSPGEKTFEVQRKSTMERMLAENGDDEERKEALGLTSHVSNEATKQVDDADTHTEKNDESVHKEDNGNMLKGKDGLDGIAKDAGKVLIAAEDREIGDVSAAVYAKWARAAGGIVVGVMMIVLYFSAEAVSVLASWWLSYWSEHREEASPWYYLGIYTAINVGVIILSFMKEMYSRLRSLAAGQYLFSDMLATVLYAPMAFFDTTPLGRIVNRFSKDIYTIDEKIPQTVRGYLSTMCKVLGVLLYISVVTPLFIVALAPVFAIYFVSQRYYIKTSRELTRLDSTSRSPIYALFSETLDGLSTIRAFQSEKRLLQKNNDLLDANQEAYFLNFSANCWLAVRLEFAGTLIVTMSAFFAVLAKQYRTGSIAQTGNDDGDEQNWAAFAGMAGLSISLALNVTQSLNWTVRMASDMESQMVSVERVDKYARMEQERPHYLPQDPPPSAWPKEGLVDMQNVHMRYRDGLPLVLRGVTIKINAREKVGIVGRTGAGKSSLLAVFLRLVELESGRVTVDGIDLSSLGLHTVRSHMAVIPQDPVLFSGTVRSNLDPFGRYGDKQLWESLRRTNLSSSISNLDDVVSENGQNFSVGQRQLMCISRALLSRAKIIIMDEATAAVDVETDSAIQKSIKEEFAEATCLTVAHRLNTIMDSDKVRLPAPYAVNIMCMHHENITRVTLRILRSICMLTYPKRI
jgi:ATP-binding cassette subfamily C (CFTR/MRP) protein 1